MFGPYLNYIPMKKITLLLGVLLLFMSLASQAQFKVIASGPSFEELEKGTAKIILLKNGVTVYLQSEKRENYRIKTYGQDHKQIVTKNLLTPKLGPLSGCELEAAFEVNGQVALFVSGFKGKTPVLYRILFKPEDGSVISETEIGKLDKLRPGNALAIAFGSVTIPNFWVVKDDYSDNYAIAFVNSFESNRDQRVTVTHYNDKHEEISTAFMSSPESKFKYIDIAHFCVMGDKEVVAVLNAFNTASSGGKESSTLIASFSNNNQNVTYNEIDIPEGFTLSQAIMRYNPVTKKIIMVSLYSLSRKLLKSMDVDQGDIEACTRIHEIDPTTKIAKEGAPIKGGAANEKYMELFARKNIFGKKSNFYGLFQNMYVNADGGITILFEGYEFTSNTSMSTNHTYTNTYLSDIFVMNFDRNGNSKSSVLIPKHHRLETTLLSGGGNYSTNQYLRDIAGSPIGAGNQYKYFSYIAGKTNNYILMNDIEENEAKVQKGKRTTIQGVGECDAFSFVSNSNNPMPSRKYIFGEPAKREHQIALLGISDYDPISNTYVTLKLEIDGRDKKVRLVWLQPE